MMYKTEIQHQAEPYAIDCYATFGPYRNGSVYPTAVSTKMPDKC